MLNIDQIRNEFPILSTQVYGKPLVYLDNGATTQTPKCVVEEMNRIYYTTNANVHRGVHYLSQLTTDLAEQARVTVQQFVNAEHNHEIIFTKGTTEAMNLMAHSFCRAYCKPGDEIIVTEMEHHANIVPWQLQEAISGVKVRVVPINNKGELCMDELKKLINDKTKLVSLTYVSNVLGTINPVKGVIELAHGSGIPVLVDAAQAIQHIEIDVQALGCDFMAFSAHKMYGPTGVGVLYGKEKYLNEMPPYQGGGEMIAKVSFDGTTFNELPFKFEAGTPNYVEVIGLGKAIEYINSLGLGAIRQHEDLLLKYATKQLLEIEGVKIYGTAKQKSSVISFLVDGVHHYDLGMMLDKMGIAVRTGHHCAEPLMQVLGIEGTVRASFAVYNTIDEIDIFISSLKRAVNMFR